MSGLFLALVAPVVLCLSLLGQGERGELVGYVTLLVIGPFLAGAADFVLERRAPGWRTGDWAAILGLGLLCLLLLAVSALLEQFLGLALLLPAVVLSGGLMIIGAIDVMTLSVCGIRLPGSLDRLASWPFLAPAALLIGFLFMAVFSPLYPGDFRVSALLGWAIERPLFPALLALGWLGTVALFGYTHIVERPLAGWLALGAALAVALLLYDDGQFVVHDHYQPYIGSALFSRAGGLPLIDVYNVYGLLTWLLVEIAYDWLPPTFGTFGVLCRLFTVAWFAAFVVIVHRLVDRKLQGCLLAAIGLLWVVTFHVNIFNMSGLPSTQGYRYFLPTLMVLLLTVEDRSWGRALAITVVSAMTALWSAESFLFAAGPVAALAVLEAIRRRALLPAMGAPAQVAAGALAAHGLFACYLLVNAGRLPDFAPYLELLGQFRPGDDDNLWVVAINPYFGLWVPVALAFFLPLAIATREALAGRRDSGRAWALVPAAVLGVGQLSYFVGRSTETTLGLALVPFLIVAIVWLDGVPDWLARRSGRRRWLDCGLLAALVAVVFAFAVERISRPYEMSRATASVLRRCFTESGCAPGEVLRRIVWNVETYGRAMNKEDPRYAVVEGEHLQERLIELERIIESSYPGGGQQVPLLVDSISLPYLGTLALADTGNWYRWPLSSPLIDFRSSVLHARIIASTETLGAGDRIIVDRVPEELLPLIQELLQALEARCRLEPVGDGDFYRVLDVRSCHDPA